MRQHIVLAVFLLGCSASHAADIDASNAGQGAWSGIYVGGAIGYADASMDGLYDSSEFAEDGPASIAFLDQLDLDGVTGGIYAGYNIEGPAPWIFGVETDWMALYASDTVLDADNEGPGTTDRAEGEIEWVASLRARLGYAVGNTLLFGTAGVAWAKGEVELCACDLQPNIDINGSTDIDSLGFVVGGGVEHRFEGTNWSARLEGLYYVFDESESLAGLTVDSDPGDFAELEDILVLRAGIGFHF